MLGAIDDYFHKNAKGKGFDVWVQFTAWCPAAGGYACEAVGCRKKQLRSGGRLATKFVRGLRQMNDNKHKYQHANEDVSGLVTHVGTYC